MAGNYNSVPDGPLLVATIIFWSFTINWMGYHIPLVGKFVHLPPLILVRDGKLQRRNMRKELITEEELMSQLRQQGIDTREMVKTACMEGDGQISVVKHDNAESGSNKNKSRQDSRYVSVLDPSHRSEPVSVQPPGVPGTGMAQRFLGGWLHPLPPGPPTAVVLAVARWPPPAVGATTTSPLSRSRVAANARAVPVLQAGRSRRRGCPPVESRGLCPRTRAPGRCAGYSS